jgi:hypothetical protein|tara:strand:- start:1149 stop:2825 length:1677 start_codon:yes stop_codon:yes gene_type:complete
MKVVKLTIDEDNEFEGIDAVALVAEPAIELDFQYFSAKKFETYNDYPKAAIAAAKQGIKRNKAIKNKCATQVGKVRAQQLANGENLSLDTIKRMRSFLLRQKDNYELAVKRSDYDACGYISYLLWGGPAALPWATKKLRMAGELKDNTQDIIMNEMGRFADIKEIEGIPVFVNENQANKMADNIGCAGSHKHEVGGTTYYMPCQSHTIATDKLLKKKEEAEPLEFHSEKHFDNFTEEEKAQLLKSLKSVGKTQESLSDTTWVEITEDEFNNSLYAEFAVTRADSNPDAGSLQDTSQFKVLYKYNGPRDSKNRTFCRQVLNLDLLYRLEDINKMSLFGANQEFSTYDIFTYKGSYNCRHAWQQKFFKREDTNNERATKNPILEEILGGPRAQQATQVSPQARTTTQIADGVPEGQFLFKAQADKYELAGPLMVADKLIPRFDEEGNKYFVFFDAEGIKKLSYKLMTNKLIDSVNIEHDPNKSISDLTLVESWLVTDPENDKSNSYGYELTKGSWFGIYKVNSKEIWDKYIKTGAVKGFSVEGIFADKTIIQSKEYNYAT